MPEHRQSPTRRDAKGIHDANAGTQHNFIQQEHNEEGISARNFPKMLSKVCRFLESIVWHSHFDLQSSGCSEDVYGGLGKMVLRRLQQELFLRRIMIIFVKASASTVTQRSVASDAATSRCFVYIVVRR